MAKTMFRTCLKTCFRAVWLSPKTLSFYLVHVHQNSFPFNVVCNGLYSRLWRKSPLQERYMNVRKKNLVSSFASLYLVFSTDSPRKTLTFIISFIPTSSFTDSRSPRLAFAQRLQHHSPPLFHHRYIGSCNFLNPHPASLFSSSSSVFFFSSFSYLSSSSFSFSSSSSTCFLNPPNHLFSISCLFSLYFYSSTLSSLSSYSSAFSLLYQTL